MNLVPLPAGLEKLPARLTRLAIVIFCLKSFEESTRAVRQIRSPALAVRVFQDGGFRRST